MSLGAPSAMACVSCRHVLQPRSSPAPAARSRRQKLVPPNYPWPPRLLVENSILITALHNHAQLALTPTASASSNGHGWSSLPMVAASIDRAGLKRVGKRSLAAKTALNCGAHATCEGERASRQPSGGQTSRRDQCRL